VDSSKEIEVLVRAKYPILYVVSWEERRVEEALAAISKKLERNLHIWSLTQDFKPEIVRNRIASVVKGLPMELDGLAQINEAPEYSIFVLRDFHPYMKDNRVIRVMRDLATKLRGKAQTIVIISPVMNLPLELEKEITVLEFPLPDKQEIESRLDMVVAAAKDNPQLDANVGPDLREKIVKSAQGLTMDEIESSFARSLVEKKRLDVDVLFEEKKQIVRKSGLLEYYPAESQMGDVGGHELLKEWLARRDKAFSEKAQEFGLPIPKGVLLLGVQGCGKSLVAKAVSASWNLPMLKMDVGRIFGSLVGQSEENIRRAIRIAESVAPCVLWADELEKGFAGIGSVGDSGTTARVFATFLTWMQEKTKPVFMLATANDVSKLPPELLRKGRFDEIFFVDLPDAPERKQIFSIHLSKRKRDPSKFNLTALVKATDGYSGAEIEALVVSGLHTAFDADRDLTDKDMLDETKATVPLSRLMEEKIDELREWAHMRARPSSKRSTRAS